MSLSDIKHSLRKYDFPQCAKEALIKIEQIVSGRGAPTNKQLDMVIDIISEFIFCETDRRGVRRNNGLNSLQELQLIDVICEYLSGCISETTKNTIFLSLFGGAESQRRAKILSILASMAISASNTPMLLAVGVWLQQTGCSTPQSLQLVESIIQDHFYLNTSNRITLNSLANSAPQFVANFITAVTELYVPGKKLPPKNLLEVITTWVYTSPTLCMSAQLNPAALPSGAIPMSAVTPLQGLIHWCALAPLYVDKETEKPMELPPPKKIKLEHETPLPAARHSAALSDWQLYTKLHLGVLRCLRSGRRATGPPTAVSAQHVSALPGAVARYRAAAAAPRTDHERLQECLDRIGQAVQVALSHGCMYGNVNLLLASLETLPSNRLIAIVIRTHRTSVP